MSIWSGAFWKATTERALRTFAQALLAVLGAEGIQTVTQGVLDVDWIQALSVAALAAVIAVLTCAATGLVPGNDGPGLTETPTE